MSGNVTTATVGANKNAAKMTPDKSASGGCGCIPCRFALTALSAAGRIGMIVVGFLFAAPNFCPASPYIPLYMMIVGCFGLVTALSKQNPLFACAKKSKRREQEYMVGENLSAPNASEVEKGWSWPELIAACIVFAYAAASAALACYLVLTVYQPSFDESGASNSSETKLPANTTHQLLKNHSTNHVIEHSMVNVSSTSFTNLTTTTNQTTSPAFITSSSSQTTAPKPHEVNRENENQPEAKYCHPVLYWYAFAATIWILLDTTFIFSYLFGIICYAFGVCDKPAQPGSQRNNLALQQRQNNA